MLVCCWKSAKALFRSHIYEGHWFKHVFRPQRIHRHYKSYKTVYLTGYYDNAQVLIPMKTFHNAFWLKSIPVSCHILVSGYVMLCFKVCHVHCVIIVQQFQVHNFQSQILARCTIFSYIFSNRVESPWKNTIWNSTCVHTCNCYSMTKSYHVTLATDICRSTNDITPSSWNRTSFATPINVLIALYWSLSILSLGL